MLALVSRIQRIKPYVERIIPLLLISDEQPKIRLYIIQMLDHARQGGESEYRGSNEAVVAFDDLIGVTEGAKSLPIPPNSILS
jgi:hypothetical protein